MAYQVAVFTIRVVSRPKGLTSKQINAIARRMVKAAKGRSKTREVTWQDDPSDTP